jgi:hypothetical protein
MLILALLACNGPDDTDPADTDPVEDTDPAGYPLDDVLTLFHVQAKGTHNSYHIAEEGADGAFDYTHQPLDVQLESQGVRNVELDIDQDPSTGVFNVRHIAFVDDETTCPTLVECITTLKTWSDAHQNHVPILVMLEIKQAYDAAKAPQFLADLETTIESVWPRDRLITPDDVQGSAASLRDAVPEGWPTLGESRGKALFILFDIEGSHRPVYTEGDTTTAGRLLFPIGKGAGPDAPAIAMHWIDDPEGNAADIAAMVELGHIIRTRADADNDEPFAGDYSRAEAALASGAHLLSTDYPVPVDGVPYVFEMPDGGAARCNPVTAPAECTTLAVENPDLLVP